MKKLLEHFKFSKPKTPGYGLQRGFYLTTMIPTPHLPPPGLVVHPQGLQGAVPGLIAPLSGQTDPGRLGQPMEAGDYAVTSPDKRTILHLAVRSKEDSGLAVQDLLHHPYFEGRSDLAQTVASTWFIAQLLVRSHHPEVGPSVAFIHNVAACLASITGGVVADPLSQRYLLPAEVRLDEKWSASDVIQVLQPTPDRLVTAGMVKFGLPELFLGGFSHERLIAARGVLFGVANKILEDGPLVPGRSLGGSARGFKAVLLEYESSQSLALVSETGKSVDEILS